IKLIEDSDEEKKKKTWIQQKKEIKGYSKSRCRAKGCKIESLSTLTMKESKECGVWTAFNRRIDTRNNNFRQEDKDDLSNLLKNILDKANIKITSNDEFYHHKI
ncbi:11311_t:CDS:2, partial [Rhizophagus irregularis]